MNIKQFFYQIDADPNINLVQFVKTILDSYNLPYTIYNNTLKASSPFRDGDSTASFNVKGNGNVWKDFGGDGISGRSKSSFLRSFLEHKDNPTNKKISDDVLVKKICELFPQNYQLKDIDLSNAFVNEKSNELIKILTAMKNGVDFNTITNTEILKECGLTREIWNQPKEFVCNEDDDVVSFYTIANGNYGQFLKEFELPKWHQAGNVFNKILNLNNCEKGQTIKICFDYNSFKSLNDKNKIYLQNNFISETQLKLLTNKSSEVQLWIRALGADRRQAIIDKFVPLLNQASILTKLPGEVVPNLYKDNLLAQVWNGTSQSTENLDLKFVPNEEDNSNPSPIANDADKNLKAVFNAVQQLVAKNIDNHPQAVNYLKQRGYSQNYIKENNLGFIDVDIFQTLLGFKLVDGVYQKVSEPICDLNLLFKTKLLRPQPVWFDVEYEKDGKQLVAKKDSITAYTLRKKIANKEINPKQLVFVPTPDGRYTAFYPRLNERITIPIYDENNNVMSFIGRSYINPKTLPAEEQQTFRKYLFIENVDGETPFNAKSNLLFNIQKIPEKTNYIVLTEGQLDATSFNFFTGENVVGLGGLTISKQQVEVLKKHTDTIYLAFDNDDNLSGEKGTVKVGKELLNAGFKVLSLDIRHAGYDVKDYDELFSKLQDKQSCKNACDKVFNQARDFNYDFTYQTIANVVKSAGGVNYTAFKDSFSAVKNQITDFNAFYDIWSKQLPDKHLNKSLLKELITPKVEIKLTKDEIKQDLKNKLKKFGL